MKSSGQGQGHRNKKASLKNSYSHNVKLWLSITPVLWSIH